MSAARHNVRRDRPRRATPAPPPAIPADNRPSGPSARVRYRHRDRRRRAGLSCKGPSRHASADPTAKGNSMAAQGAQRAGTRPVLTHPNWTLAATILASSLAFIDGSVVNVALPAIGRSLHGDAAG